MDHDPSSFLDLLNDDSLPLDEAPTRNVAETSAAGAARANRRASNASHRAVSPPPPDPIRPDSDQPTDHTTPQTHNEASEPGGPAGQEAGQEPIATGSRRGGSAAPARRARSGDPRPLSLHGTAAAINSAVLAGDDQGPDLPTLALLPFIDAADTIAFLRDHRGLPTRPRGISEAAIDVMAPLALEAMRLAASLPHTHPHRASAHALVLSFPTLMLRPFPPGATNDAAQAESARRAALWKAGRFHDLRREAVAARSAAGTSENRRDDTAEKAALLVREGAFGRASALAQSHGLVQDPEEAARALAALHPPRRRVSGFVPPGAPARVPPQAGSGVDLSHLKRAIRGMPKRAATHVDGWRWEHVRDLASHDHGAEDILKYVSSIVRADVPPIIADYLATATLFPFNKRSESTIDELRDQARASDPDAPFTPPLLGPWRCLPYSYGWPAPACSKPFYPPSSRPSVPLNTVLRPPMHWKKSSSEFARPWRAYADLWPYTST